MMQESGKTASISSIAISKATDDPASEQSCSKIFDPITRQFQNNFITAIYHSLAIIMLIIGGVYSCWSFFAPRFSKPEVLLINNYCIRSSCRNQLSPTPLTPIPTVTETTAETTCATPPYTQILEYSLVNFSYLDIDKVELSLFIDKSEYRSVDFQYDGTDLDKKEVKSDDNYNNINEDNNLKHVYVITPKGTLRSNSNHTIRMLHFQHDSNPKWRPERIILKHNGVKLKDAKNAAEIQMTIPFSRSMEQSISIFVILWIVVLFVIELFNLRYNIHVVPMIISQEISKAKSAATTSLSNMPKQTETANDLREIQKQIENPNA